MNKDIILKELEFKAVRSSGAGGQHVNKVSSKIELYFNISSSDGLSDNEKTLLISRLSSKLTKDNTLIISCQDSRSQHSNKEFVIKRFFNLIEQKSKPKKIRKQTKPSKASKLKRLLNKKRLAEKKGNRKKIKF